MRSMRIFKNLFFVMLMALVLFIAVGCGSKIELSFEDETYTVEVGKELPIDPIVVNKDEVEYTLVYSSEDSTIATYVDGKVKGVKVGEVTVKVTLEGDEDVFATVTVKVIEAKKFKVTFNTNGGSNIAETNIVEGEKVAEPNDPTKAGFVFAGWYTNEGLTLSYDFNKAVTAALTLYAKWEVAEYTVTFNSNGGSEVTATGVNHGEKIAEPTAPTKENYQFLGWYADVELTEEFDFETEVTSDLTIYAKWELNTYNVIFNVNGGSAVDNLVVNHGEKATKPADPTKEEYIFKGWFKDAALTTEFDFETEVITADTVVFAKWDLDMTGKVITEFELNGGEFPITSLDAFIGAEPVATGVNIVLNETASGYYVSATEGTYLTSMFLNDKNFEMTPSVWQNRAFINRNDQGFFEVQLVKVAGSANTNPPLEDYEYVLFAHSSYAAGYSLIGSLQVGQIIAIDGFDITTISQGPLTDATVKVYAADSTMSTAQALYADDTVLPLPLKEEFEFAGWYTNENFTGEAVTKAVNGKVYAKWVDKAYTVTYEFDGGAFPAEFLSSARTKMIEDFLTDFYNFLDLEGVDLTTFMHGEGKTSGYEGLYFTADNFAKLYAANNKSVDASTGLFINQPEYNKWVPLLDLIDEYTKLNPDQGFWSSPTTVGIHRIKPFMIQKNIWGSWIDLDAFNRIKNTVIDSHLPYSFTVNSAEIVLPAAVKADHNFIGWYTNAEFTGDAVTKIATGSKGNMKLYAKFELITYTVEFDTNEGSAIDSAEVEINSKLTKPVDPTKEGFMFTGWYTDEALTVAFDFETAITEDITLYAAWVAFVNAEVDYTAVVNEDRGTYYIKVTVPGTALLESDIKSVHTYIAAGEYVEPVELGIVAGDPYLWFGVAKLDADLGLKENGIYAYKVVRQDDSIFVFSFDYDKANVTDIPDRLGAELDYAAVYNETRKTWYIKVTVANNEELNTANITKIRTVKVAGEMVTPVELGIDAEGPFMWFGVADELGVPTLKESGLYAYEVTRTDGSMYVFEFAYDNDLVTGLPEVQTADIDYAAVWNETRGTWYIKVTADEDLDATTIKSISLVKEAGIFVTPVELTPDTDKVLWLGVALADGQLTLKAAGEYMYKVVRQDDTEYVFGFIYNPDSVTGIMHTVEFVSNEGSVVDPLQVEKGQVTVKPADPTKEGYTFQGWFTDEALTTVFDWEIAVTANITLYAKWDIVNYTISYNLNGGEFVIPLFDTKEDMMEAFLVDFYDYVKPTEDLATFMHGAGNTSGYKGTWHSSYKAKIYAGPRPTAVNESYFSSSSKYMDKWLPFLDLIDSLVKQTNATQYFFGTSTWTGLIRLEEYFSGARYADNKTIPAAFKLLNEYNVESPEIVIRPVKSDVEFLGWFDNAEFSGDAITTIPTGSIGNITLYAKWEKVILTVSDVRDNADGDIVVTKGIVTSVIGNNAFIQDSTGGIYLYLSSTSTFADSLVVGNEVKVYGELDIYNGLTQIRNLTAVEVINTAQTLPAAVELTDLVLADVLAQQGKLITINGLTIKSIPTIGTNSYTVIVTNGTIDLEVRVDKFIANFAEVNALFESAVVGQNINLVSIPVGHFNAPQVMVSNVLQLVLQPLTSEQVETILDNELDPGTDLIADVNLKTSETLGENTYTVVWTSDNTNVLSNTGVVTRPALGSADVIVQLSAEVKLGETVIVTLVYDVKVLAQAAGELAQIGSTITFEAPDYTASTTYNNSTEKVHGPTDAQWSILSGTPSTSSALNDSISMQMRYYNSVAKTPYLKTNFTVENLKEIKFIAANTSENKVEVSYSTDGTTWIGAQIFDLTTTGTEYTYTLDTAVTAYVKFSFVQAASFVDKSQVKIDNVSFWG